MRIVGTRCPSLYGKRAAVQLVRELCKNSWTIVSGLAKGIDGLAHQESIRSKGRTIGVIAGGFNSIYPREHRQLAGQMAESHLLVSEHPPHIKPQGRQTRSNDCTAVDEGRKRAGASRYTGDFMAEV